MCTEESLHPWYLGSPTATKFLRLSPKDSDPEDKQSLAKKVLELVPGKALDGDLNVASLS